MARGQSWGFPHSLWPEAPRLAFIPEWGVIGFKGNHGLMASAVTHQVHVPTYQALPPLWLHTGETGGYDQSVHDAHFCPLLQLLKEVGIVGPCFGTKLCPRDFCQAKSIKDIKIYMRSRAFKLLNVLPNISIPHYFHCCWVLTLYDLVFGSLSTWRGENCSVLTKLHVCSVALSPLLGARGLCLLLGEVTLWTLFFRWFWRAARSAALGPLELMQTPPALMLSSKFRLKIQPREHLAGELEIFRNCIVCLFLMWLWNMCYQQQDTMPPQSSLFQG